jgi:Xaa-Pro aminopeptidase
MSQPTHSTTPSDLPNTHAFDEHTALLFAGAPATNMALYHRCRFLCGDPSVWMQIGPAERVFLVRDIEAGRARNLAHADRVEIPADFAPSGGLASDRETATAQAAAELLRQHGVTRVIGDRSLGLIYADHLRAAGIAVEYDADLGVVERRAKDGSEVEHLHRCQRLTEGVIARACETIARADVASDGTLMHDSDALTSDRVRSMISVWLLELGLTNPYGSIVAGLPHTSDCHHRGEGVLRTSEAIIIDVFPRDPSTLYHGDCTRTVVHGDIPDAVAKMHRAVTDAKRAAIESIKPGVTCDAVHAETVRVIEANGYPMGLPDPNDVERGEFCTMPHGTGHGIGLDVHEPPLVDIDGPTLMVGDCVTIEPGLYGLPWGGVRIEDMIVVTEAGYQNLNEAPEGLTWS